MKTQPSTMSYMCLKKVEDSWPSPCQTMPLNNGKISLHPETISPNILPESREISLNKCRVS